MINISISFAKFFEDRVCIKAVILIFLSITYTINKLILGNKRTVQDRRLDRAHISNPYSLYSRTYYERLPVMKDNHLDGCSP